MASLEDIPSDLIFHIFTFCKFNSACKLSILCRSFREEIFQYPIFWEYQLTLMRNSDLYDFASQEVKSLFSRKPKKSTNCKSRRFILKKFDDLEQKKDVEKATKLYEAIIVQFVGRRLQLVSDLERTPSFKFTEKDAQRLIEYRQFLWNNFWWMMKHYDGLLSSTKLTEGLKQSVGNLKSLDLGKFYVIDVNLVKITKKGTPSHSLMHGYVHDLLESIFTHVREHDGIDCPAFSLMLHSIYNGSSLEELKLIEKLYSTKTDMKAIMKRGRQRWKCRISKGYSKDFVDLLFGTEDVTNDDNLSQSKNSTTTTTSSSLTSSSSSTSSSSTSSSSTSSSSLKDKNNLIPYRLEYKYSDLEFTQEDDFEYSKLFYSTDQCITDDIYSLILDTNCSRRISALLNSDILWLGLDKGKLLSHMMSQKKYSPRTPIVLTSVENIEVWLQLISLGVQTHDSPYFHPNELLIHFIQRHPSNDPEAIQCFQKIIDHPYYQKDPRHLNIPAKKMNSWGHILCIPLDLAARLDQTNYTEILLKAGADPNAGSSQDWTEHCYNFEQVDLFIRYKAPLPRESLFNICSRDFDFFKTFIQKYQVNLNIHDPSNGKTLLSHVIISNLETNAVELMLNQGADPRLKSKQGLYENMNSIDLVNELITKEDSENALTTLLSIRERLVEFAKKLDSKE